MLACTRASRRACPFSPVLVRLVPAQRYHRTGRGSASVGEARFRSGPGERGACAGLGAAGGERVPGLVRQSRAAGAGPRRDALSTASRPRPSSRRV